MRTGFDVLPRFAILYHQCPVDNPRSTHWDLLLEEEGKLRTWAMASEPVPGIAIDAEQLADHRLEYLTYEGPISNDRGSVTRWDEGSYTLLEDDSERILLLLNGQRIAGQVELCRESSATQRWRVMWSRS